MKCSGKRITVWLLLLCISLSACAGGTESEDPGMPEIPSSAEATAANAAEGEKPAEIPEEEAGIPAYPYAVRDLSGRNFTILNCDDGLWQGTFHVIDYEEESGEAISDAIFRRARHTEETFNCVMNVEKPSGDLNVISQTLGNAVTAGDDIYDAAYSGLASFGSALTNSYGINLHDIETLRMNEPWWNQMFVENMTINNYLNSSIDYVCMMGYGYSNVLFFNKEMFTNLNIPLPYDQVREGTWTYDAMYKCLEVGVNLNGAESFNDAPSVLGYTIQHEEGTMVMLAGSGEFLVSRDETGTPHVRTDLERMQSAASKLSQMFQQEGYCLMSNGPAMQSFIDNRAMFFQTALGVSAETFRELDFAYGILPLPKYDEAQEQYYTMISEYTLSLQIPKSAADPEMSGNVIDYMGYHGYYDIVPVMQDTFCYKGLRDQDSIDMMNITLETMAVDVGYLYGWSSSVVKNISSAIAKGSDTFASLIASATKSTTKLMERSIEKLGN